MGIRVAQQCIANSKQIPVYNNATNSMKCKVYLLYYIHIIHSFAAANTDVHVHYSKYKYKQYNLSIRDSGHIIFISSTIK